MSLKYGKFEIPSQIQVEEQNEEETFARITAGPFEKGYGHTLGNALRRMMLTSIESPAIVSIAIEGVPHEYMAVEGMVEDVTSIVLNFKSALLKSLGENFFSQGQDLRVVSTKFDVTKEDLDRANGQVPIRLGDLLNQGAIEVVNPDLVLFHVTRPMHRQVDLRISKGRGYAPSERHHIFDKQPHEIVIDSLFSPVRLVNYFVENTRVGQNTDYDRLVFEITTDGRVSPLEALSFAAQIGELHFDVFKRLQSYNIVFDEDETQDAVDDEDIFDKLSLRIDEIELSVRSTNCLSGANIETIAELVCIPDRKMLEFRNFGKKSLHEIRQKLTDMSLHLGMDLSRYGITPDNVKEKMRQHNEVKKGRKEVFAKEEEGVT